MTETVRIAHLSDLHIHQRHPRETLRKTRALLAHLRALHVDHVVVTGDITADGHRQELELFRNLFASFGLLDPRRLSVVVGNHDIFGGVHSAEDVLTFPARMKSVPYRKQLAQFVEAVPEAFGQCVFGRTKSVFPYLKELGPHLLVGINTVAHYSRLGNPFGSNGAVEDEQYEALAALFSLASVKRMPKIVLAHHHFCKTQEKANGTMHSLWTAIERQTMKLRGKKRLLRLFEKNDVRLVLHGHVHESFAYERRGITFLNAGGSVLGPSPERLAFNLITVSPEGIQHDVLSIPAPAPHALPSPHRAIPRVLPAPSRPGIPLPEVGAWTESPAGTIPLDR